MSATSFQFRYPLNRQPYVADQETPIIYPYPQWGDYGTSSNLYVYGSKKIPFRSYFGQDVNLTARPISRVIQPSVVEYAPISAPSTTGESSAAVTLAPTLVPGVAFGNRFNALNSGDQQVIPLKLWGAQVGESLQSAVGGKNSVLLALILLAAAGALIFLGRSR